MNVIFFEPNGRNRTPDVVEALTHVVEQTTLRFAPGRYDFYAEGAYEDIFYPVCNRSGTKRVIFPLMRLKDVTIDGGGAEFIFHDRVSPFIAQNCSGVTFRDFSIDFSFPRCCVCNVISNTEEGLLLDMDVSGCKWGVTGEKNLYIDAGIDRFATCEMRFFMKQQRNVCYLVAGEYFYENNDNPAPVFYCDAEKTENGMLLRRNPETDFFPDFEPGPLMLSYDELRQNDVFFLDRDENVLFENVRIYHGAGMGVIGQLVHNLTLRRFVVAPPDGSGDVYSTTADAILLLNCTGLVDIDHCRVEYPMDDAIAVAGGYTVVERITAPNKVRARLNHASHAGYNFYFPGDVVTVSSFPSLNETGRATVKSSRFDDDPFIIFLEFEEDIRGILHPGDYLENPGLSPEVSVTNCFLSDFPAVRLVSEKPIRFENNFVRRCHTVEVNDLMQYWYTGGVSDGVTIANNVFMDMDCALASVMERPEDSDVRHKNITITGNHFENCRKLLNADAVNGLIFRDNISDGSTGITLTRCENTDIQEI